MRVILLVLILAFGNLSAWAVGEQPDCPAFVISPEGERLGGQFVFNCFGVRGSDLNLTGAAGRIDGRLMTIDRRTCDCLQEAPTAVQAFNVGAQAASRQSVITRANEDGLEDYYDAWSNIEMMSNKLSSTRNGMMFQASILDPSRPVGLLTSRFNVSPMDNVINPALLTANQEISRRYPPRRDGNFTEDRMPSIQALQDTCMLNGASASCTPQPRESCISQRAFAAMSMIPSEPEFFEIARSLPERFDDDDWNYSKIFTELKNMRNDRRINLNKMIDGQVNPIRTRMMTLAGRIEFLNRNQLFKNLFQTSGPELSQSRRDLYRNLRESFSGMTCQNVGWSCAQEYVSSDRFSNLMSASRDIFANQTVIQRCNEVANLALTADLNGLVDRITARAPKMRYFNTSPRPDLPETSESTNGSGPIVVTALGGQMPECSGEIQNVEMLESCVRRFGTFCRNIELAAPAFTADSTDSIIDTGYPEYFRSQQGTSTPGRGDQSGQQNFCMQARFSSGTPPQQSDFLTFKTGHCVGARATTPECTQPGNPDLLRNFIQAFPNSRSENDEGVESFEVKESDQFVLAFLGNPKNNEIIRDLAPGEAEVGGQRFNSTEYNAGLADLVRRERVLKEEKTASIAREAESNLSPKTDAAIVVPQTLVRDTGSIGSVGTPTLSAQIPTRIQSLQGSPVLALDAAAVRGLAETKETEVREQTARLADIPRREAAATTDPERARLLAEAEELRRTIEQNRTTASDYRSRVIELEQAQRATADRGAFDSGARPTNFGTGSSEFQYQSVAPQSAASGNGSLGGGQSLASALGGVSGGNPGRVLPIRFDERETLRTPTGAVALIVAQDRVETSEDQSISGVLRSAVPINLDSVPADVYAGFESRSMATLNSYSALINRTPGQMIRLSVSLPGRPVITMLVMKGRNGQLLFQPVRTLASLNGVIDSATR